jgi:hypothetical protein
MARFLLGCFWIACAGVGFMVGNYVFNGNAGGRGVRFVWTVTAATTATVLLALGLKLLAGLLLRLGNLVWEHPRTFLRGAWRGGAGGLFVGALLLDRRDVLLHGPAIVLLLSVVAAVVHGVNRAQSERDGERTTAGQSNEGLIAPALGAVCLTVVFLALPQVVLVPYDMDCSWAATLIFALRRGLQFGTDIVISDGPLGFLSIPWFSSEVAGVRFVADVAILFLSRSASV